MTPREGAALGSLLGLVAGAIGGDLLAAVLTPDMASQRKAVAVSRSTMALGALVGTIGGAIIGAGPDQTVATTQLPPTGTGATQRLPR